MLDDLLVKCPVKNSFLQCNREHGSQQRNPPWSWRSTSDISQPRWESNKNQKYAQCNTNHNELWSSCVLHQCTLCDNLCTLNMQEDKIKKINFLRIFVDLVYTLSRPETWNNQEKKGWRRNFIMCHLSWYWRGSRASLHK